MRAKMTSGESSSRAQLDVREATQHLTRDHRGARGLDQPDLAGDRERGARMVAGRHDHADPGLAALAERALDFRARRILHADQPGPHEILLQGFASPRRLERAVGEGQDAQALLRHAVLRGQDRAAQLGRERAGFAIDQEPVAQWRDRLGRPFAVEHRAVAPSHGPWTSACGRCRTGSSWTRVGLGRGRQDRLRHLDQGDLHGVAQEERRSQVLAFPEIVTEPGDEKERQVGLGQPVRRPSRIKGVLSLTQEELFHQHAILGQRSRLVGADHGRGSERPDRGQVANEHVASGHALGGEHEGQRQRRKQAFRHHGDDDADREDEGVPERNPA